MTISHHDHFTQTMCGTGRGRVRGGLGREAGAAAGDVQGSSRRFAYPADSCPAQVEHACHYEMIFYGRYRRAAQVGHGAGTCAVDGPESACRIHYARFGTPIFAIATSRSCAGGAYIASVGVEIGRCLSVSRRIHRMPRRLTSAHRSFQPVASANLAAFDFPRPPHLTNLAQCIIIRPDDGNHDWGWRPSGCGLSSHASVRGIPHADG